MEGTGKQDLVELTQRLLKSGPFKTHPAQGRRIRILFNKTYIADTTDALYVWEHPGYPYYYLPWAAFGDEGRSFIEDDDKSRATGSTDSVGKSNGQGGEGFLERGVKGNEEGADGIKRSWKFVRHVKDEGDHVGATIYELEVWDDEGKRRSTGARIVEFARGELVGLLRVEFGAVDQWFEEDTPIHVHPKDPFKRIDIITSTRPIRISVEGVTVAESQSSMHLYETKLPCRYYIPRTSIKPDVLRSSNTKTKCPYKGEAEYYDVVLPSSGGQGERVFKDLVWYYDRPTVECAAVTGMPCFYNEKVDIWLDGVKLTRPNSPFSTVPVWG